jgi:prepilin-type N-terminal cleavage/methylation domain-containing protein
MDTDQKQNNTKRNHQKKIKKKIGSPSLSFKKIAGFSLVEVMVAVGILGIVGLAIGTQTNQFSRFFSKTRKILEQDLDSVVSHKILVQDLEHSYFMKMGYVDCQSSKPLLSTQTEGSIEFQEKSSDIDMVVIDYSSFAGLSHDGQWIILSQVSKLNKGDYLVLSLAGDSQSASLFLIQDIQPELNRVALITTSFVEPQFNCESHFVSKTPGDYFSSSTRSNVLASRIKPIKYRFEDESLKRFDLKIKNSQGDILYHPVTSVKINSRWSSLVSQEVGSKEGRMDFEITVNQNKVSHSQSSDSKSSDSTALKKNAIQARFILDSATMVNSYALIGTPTSTVKFPSCMVTHQFKNNILKLDPRNNWWRNTSSLTLTGSVSVASVVGASISVQMSPHPKAKISCFLHDPIVEGAYPKTGLVTEVGEQSFLSLSQKLNGFDTYTCGAQGVVDIQATMTYFDTNINQIKTIECSADSIVASTEFQLMTSLKPYCKKKVRMFPEISTSGEIKGFDHSSTFGRFGFHWETACQWDGQSDASLQTGVASDCGHQPHPLATLKRVYLRPYRVDVRSQDGQSFFTQKEGAYVDCQ